jgi:beta-glucosidase
MKAYKYPYQNPHLSDEERAEDLLARMSLEEKMGQIQCYNPAASLKDNLSELHPHGVGEVSSLVVCSVKTKEEVAEKLRLIQEKVMALSEHHIPALFHIETLTGVLMPEATSFPTGIGQGSTWDPELQKKMGAIIREEAKAIGARQAFAPVLDISRDSRFGRQGETYGEDPALASSMGSAYIQGIQNDEELKKGLIATTKHFIGYHSSQGGIHAATCDIPARALREIYAKPFQSAITNGKLKSVMNSYGVINGKPIAGSKSMLTNLLREEMEFQGLVVSDYCSISELHSRHRICESSEEAGICALKAGMDVETPSKDCYGDGLMEMIRDGKVDIYLLDRAVRRVLLAKFQVGLFENPFPFAKEDVKKVFHSKEAKDVSLQMARESLILMKNNGILPIKPAGKKIAVIGHHANSSRMLFGGYSFMSMAECQLGAKNTMAGAQLEETYIEERGKYSGSNVDIEQPQLEMCTKDFYPEIKNLLEQLREVRPKAEIRYAYGYPYVGNDMSHHDEALKIAKEADIVILTLGGKYGWGSVCSTGEGIDSTSINLPECQEIFLEKLGKLGIPTIAIHLDGRPISSDAADTYADAILEAWNPGEYGAEAIVSILIGEYNPGGKLPVSVAYNAGQIPVFYNHDNGSGYDVNTDSAFKSYVDKPHEPRYYFGHGLSYTTFCYSNLVLNKHDLYPDDILTVSVDIQNVGEVSGDEIVQIYVKDRFASMVRPVMELAGFRRVTLSAGEVKTIIFSIHPSQLAFLDKDMKWKVEAGEVDVLVGASSKDIRLNDCVRISTDKYVNGASRKFFATSELI